MKSFSGLMIVIVALCASPARSETIEEVSSGYLSALSDHTEDGFLLHNFNFMLTLQKLEESNPKDMWPAIQENLRNSEIQAMLPLRLEPFRVEGESVPCVQLVQGGAKIEIRETRATEPGVWKVFYDISYPTNAQSSPEVEAAGNPRFLQSVSASIEFHTMADGKILGDTRCLLVAGSSRAWPVPELTQDEAIEKSKGLMIWPVGYNMEMSRSVGILQNPSYRWNDFIAMNLQLKEVLEKHGWIVSGFQIPSPGYYSMQGVIDPSPTIKDLVNLYPERLVGQGDRYVGLLLDKPIVEVVGYVQSGDRAILRLTAKFTGCTEICELWKELRGMPREYGAGVFFGAFGLYHPELDLDQAFPVVAKFRWMPRTGWTRDDG